MPSRTYVAQRLGAFAGLVQANELAGYRLEPLPAVGLRDYYYDTDDAVLLRQGMCLRVRDQNGMQRALLRPIRPEDEGPAVEVALEGIPEHDFESSDGPMHEALEALVGGHAPGRVSPLKPLLQLRQYRTPRVAYEGTRLVGVLSFDVVVLELPDGPHAANELDVEMAEDGLESDIHALDPLLRAGGLAPVDLTKFERHVRRLPRSLTQPLLLLPSEREVLEVFAASESPLHRRRAEVLLLDARGFRSATIATQIGLSTARVRHWKALFREQRMAIFETPTSAPVAEPPRYHVSEIVHGAAVAAPGSRALPPLALPTPLGPTMPTETPEASAIEDVVFPPTDEAATAESDVVVPALNSAAGGDGVPTDLPPLSLPNDLGDIDDLLDLFQPRSTGTPLLDDEPEPDGPQASDDVAVGAGDEEGEGWVLPEDSVHGRIETDPEPHSATRRPPVGELVETERVGDNVATVAQSVEAGSFSNARTTRRPRIHPDDSLVSAALDVLAYHFGQIGWCAADLEREKGAFRLYLAVHRVRLSLEVFQPALPQETVQALHRGLRRLAAGLSHSLALEQQLEHDPLNTQLSERSDRARESVRALLEDRSFETWIGLAQRLVDRLALQKRAGVETPDDAPAPWDDYAAEPGAVRARSRMRHLLGSALWTRVEALLAWEQTGAAPRAADAQHIALACAGIRFVLGLAESAAPQPVRAADVLLERTESTLLAIHRGSSTLTPEASESAMLQAWTLLRSEPLRSSLGKTLAEL